MLFLSCNNTLLSKDMASLGFTSVSNPWEVVYYFLPGITGPSQGSSLGSRIIGFWQNTTSVPGWAAGLAAAGCCLWGCCRWGWLWVWYPGGSGMLPVGMLPVGRRDVGHC